MKKAEYKKALSFTLKAEDGFVVDNGGPTNHGVTQTTYDEYRDLNGAPRRDVRDICSNEVEDLYYRLYWVRACCPFLGTYGAVAHFDWAVNHGAVGAVRTLQGVTGARVDGRFGPKTRRAVETMDDLVLTTRYMAARDRWYDENHERVAPEAYNGWRNRVHRLWAFLLSNYRYE